MPRCAPASVACARNACTRKCWAVSKHSPHAFGRRIAELADSPLALHTDAANRQHYEVPAAFFQACLGRRLKYSSCYYPTGRETLDQAEDAMLELYGQRAGLADGQQILELGCGWGSLTLWMAERYPTAAITAVSNSHSHASTSWRSARPGAAQRRGDHPRRQPARAANRTLRPLRLVEMFEHVRNYERLLARITMAEAYGALFVHIFAHRTLMYPFETEGGDNWMGRHFFTGGLMPAADTLLHFQRDLRLDQRWLLDGTHYQRTADHWLANQDAAREAVMPVLVATIRPGRREDLVAALAHVLDACAELFGYDDGQQWLVAHYLFRPR